MTNSLNGMQYTRRIGLCDQYLVAQLMATALAAGFDEAIYKSMYSRVNLIPHIPKYPSPMRAISHTSPTKLLEAPSTVRTWFSERGISWRAVPSGDICRSWSASLPLPMKKVQIRVDRGSVVLSLFLEATRLGMCQWSVIKVLSEGRQDMKIATQTSTADQLRGATRNPDGSLVYTLHCSERRELHVWSGLKFLM